MNHSPTHQAGLSFGAKFSGKYIDLTSLNQEGPPNQKPSPDQPFDLPTQRQVHTYIFY